MPHHLIDLARRLLTRPTPRPIARRPRLMLQALEGREVPSGNPVARDDAYTLHQGAASTVLGSVLANDEGGTVALRGYVTAPATAGTTFAFNSYGASVRYKPRAGAIAADGTITSAFVGTDTFQYVLKEGGYTSAPATGTIAVTNADPVAVRTDRVFSTAAGAAKHFGPAEVVGTDNVTDGDGDAVGMVTADMTKTNVSFSTVAGGTVWMNFTTGFSYKPPARSADGTPFTGWDSFDYRLWDKAGFTDTITAHVYVGDGPAPELPSIGGTVYADANEDGSLGDWTDGDNTEQEPGLGQVTVQLLKGGSVVATTTTADDGSYTFAHLVAGAYTVKLVGREGFDPTTVTEQTVAVAVTAAGPSAPVRFGLKVPVLVETPFEDTEPVGTTTGPGGNPIPPPPITFDTTAAKAKYEADRAQQPGLLLTAQGKFEAYQLYDAAAKTYAVKALVATRAGKPEAEVAAIKAKATAALVKRLAAKTEPGTAMDQGQALHDSLVSQRQTLRLVLSAEDFAGLSPVGPAYRLPPAFQAEIFPPPPPNPVD